jgi:pilus assembly protein FimV
VSSDESIAPPDEEAQDPVVAEEGEVDDLDDADVSLDSEVEPEAESDSLDTTDAIDLEHFSEEDFQLDTDEAELTSEKQQTDKSEQSNADELADFDPSWDDTFDTIEDAELPTFDEEDARSAVDDVEDEPFPTESITSKDLASQEDSGEIEDDHPAAFWDELDEIFLDDELPSFDEEQALEEFTKDQKDQAERVDNLEVDDLEPEETSQAIDESSDADDRDFLLARQEFDVGDLDDLLVDDDEDQPHFNFERPTTESADSAGMDIGAMLDQGGEDWNGFKLTPEQKAAIPNDVPAEEKAIWREDIQTDEPKLAEEDWADQDDLDNEVSNPKQFLTVDELMAQADAYDELDDEEDFKLDVGLDDFPDVIGKISAIDVDHDSEISGKLDLAKIYMEMNDDEGAIKLLEKVIVEGGDVLRREAKQLIDQIRRQR